METKSKWQSKTVWTAVITAILAGVAGISTALGHPVVVPAWVYEMLAGFGLYALRVGVTKPLQ